MKTKTYAAEKVEQVAQALADAPALAPKFITHDDTINELSKHIKELHFKKNYDARQIVQLLKQNGIKTTLKEVRELLENGVQKRPRKTTKNDEECATVPATQGVKKA